MKQIVACVLGMERRKLAERLSYPPPRPLQGTEQRRNKKITREQDRRGIPEEKVGWVCGSSIG